jgi:hypothetical protein
VPVNTDNLTNAITGQFSKPIRDITAREMFMEIGKAHFNVNTGKQERNAQKRILAEKKKGSSTVVVEQQGKKGNKVGH